MTERRIKTAGLSIEDLELAKALPRAFPGKHKDKEGIARTWELIRRAVLTHDALPGKRRASLVSRIDIVREINEAYGYTDVRPPKFVASPRDVSNMLPVLKWLCEHRRKNNGERDFKLLLARARGVPWWKLATKFGRSERQVQRWLDGAVTDIYLDNRAELWERVK